MGGRGKIHDMHEVVDVTDRVRDADVSEVLKVVAWRGTDDELDRIGAPYVAGPGRLYGLIIGGQLVSCVGIWPASGGAELRTVATRADCRNHGYASELIQRLVEDLDLDVIWAETDDDAVGFYRSAGFEIEDLGERYPGVVRYRCTRQRSRPRAHEV